VLGRGSLLKPATRQARLEAIPLDGSPLVRYGEGIQLIGPFIGHDGLIFGSSNIMVYLPPLRATVVINVSRADSVPISQTTRLFLNLTKIVFPDYVKW
jgi:D-alanyl-D-alanine carboxypeptidase